MSSRSYLANEARWAREQERTATRRVEELTDPRWLRRERDAASRKVFMARHAFKTALRDLADLSDENLPASIAAAEKDATHWRDLAEGYERRIEQSEDQALMEIES